MLLTYADLHTLTTTRNESERARTAAEVMRSLGGTPNRLLSALRAESYTVRGVLQLIRTLTPTPVLLDLGSIEEVW